MHYNLFPVFLDIYIIFPIFAIINNTEMTIIAYKS